MCASAAEQDGNARQAAAAASLPAPPYPNPGSWAGLARTHGGGAGHETRADSPRLRALGAPALWEAPPRVVRLRLLEALAEAARTHLVMI
ncbi:MAG: hypothetical protein ACK55Z_18130, partial [bacterium]